MAVEDKGRAHCVKCGTKEHTKCIDDMLTIGYVAEIFECTKCAGVIAIEYKCHTISQEAIKTYTYRATGD